MQRVLVPLLLLICLPLSAQAANPIFCGTGANADVLINAATATALANGGGTVDCRSLIGNQTVAANITLNAPNTKYIFSDGVTFVPNAANLFINGTVDGVEIECGGAGGTVFDWHLQNSGTTPIISFNSSNIRIHHCTFIGDRLLGVVGNTGSCLRLLNSATAESNLYVEDNVVQNCPGTGINVQDYSNVHILRNLVTQTGTMGIQFATGATPATAIFREIEIAGNILYDDNTTNKMAVGPMLVSNANAPGVQVQGVVIRNNVVKNDIVGGDSKGTAFICNISGTFTATGCGPSIQVNNASFVSILDNIVENTQAECISFTSSEVIVRGNRLSLCGGTVNTNPTTITTAGAGGILVFLTDAGSPLQNILIDANHVTNSGYGVGAILGNSVVTDSDKLENVVISNNVIAATDPATPGLTVIRGINLDNRSGMMACSGRQCNFALINMNIVDNTVYNAFTQAYSLKPIATPGSLTGAPNLVANLGNIGATVTANCNSGASPAQCSGAATGSVAIPIGVTTLVVNTTAVTAVSQIRLQFDETLTVAGVTCNAVAASEGATYFVNARVPGTSFTIKTSAAPPMGTNPACLSYSIVN